MIIVTPPKGQWAEPRPQALITGDRAANLLDGSASTAFQAAGVKLVTVSPTVYKNITATLVAESNTDTDPATGKLKSSVLPAWLSESAIAALDVLDNTNHLAEAYVPPRLSTATLTGMIAANNSAVVTTDPDGTPVITAGNAHGTDATYTGTVSASGFTAGSGHADAFTATVATIPTLETTQVTFDTGPADPATPSANTFVLYADQTGRLAYKDGAATARRLSSVRFVTSWPAAGDSHIGDLAQISATGELRIYKGAVLGWRLLGDHTCFSLDERAALISPYAGMRVFLALGNGHDQEHVFGSDGKWHGTRPYRVQGGSIRLNQNVNDTNFRRWNETEILDPGFDYFLTGQVSLEIVQLATKSRAELWWSVCDHGTGQHWVTYHKSYSDDAVAAFCQHFENSLQVWDTLSGSKTVCLDWRVRGNGANAYSGNYEATNDYLVHPV